MVKEAIKPRERRLDVGILNVKVDSDIPAKYERLFELVSAIEHVKVRGAEFGTIGYLRKKEEHFLVGEVYLFLNIDPREPWYDAQKKVPVEPDAIGKETLIFGRLKPHLKKRTCAFDFRNHSFYFDSKGFSPNTAKKFFDSLCLQADICQLIGDVDIRVHATKQSIDAILDMKNMVYLEIFLTKLNPEGLTEAQRELHQELIDEGVISRREITKSTKEIRIKPQARTKNLIYLSRTNGYTHATEYIDNKLVAKRTEDHPEIISENYFVKTETPVDALLRVAENVYQNMMP